MNTGREENAAIFRNTEKMCRTHPRLREAIAFSRANQRLIPEGDAVSVPPGGNAPGRLVVSPKRTFKAASAYGAEAVVLGAFGCGAFRNDPAVVAAAAAAVVPRYRTHFKVIEFAIYCRPGDTRNIDAFKRAFR